MGIISSTDMKPENFEQKSQNNQVPSEKLGSPEKVEDSSSGWRDRMHVYMKGGGCKEALADFQDCVAEAEKKRESTGQCVPKLKKCMEAHFDYYQPVLAAEKAAEEVLMKAFMTSTVSLNEEEQEEEKFMTFMKGGGCKESYTAWYDCFCAEEAEMNKEDFVTKCAGLYAMLSKCMDAHSDYYQPLLVAKKTTEEHWAKELKASFDG